MLLVYKSAFFIESFGTGTSMRAASGQVKASYSKRTIFLFFFMTCNLVKVGPFGPTFESKPGIPAKRQVSLATGIFVQGVELGHPNWNVVPQASEAASGQVKQVTAKGQKYKKIFFMTWNLIKAGPFGPTLLEKNPGYWPPPSRDKYHLRPGFFFFF